MSGDSVAPDGGFGNGVSALVRTFAAAAIWSSSSLLGPAGGTGQGLALHGPDHPVGGAGGYGVVGPVHLVRHLPEPGSRREHPTPARQMTSSLFSPVLPRTGLVVVGEYDRELRYLCLVGIEVR